MHSVTEKKVPKPKNRKGVLVLIGCIVASLTLLALNEFYLNNLHHRIGGVAWGGLFQIFGNFFGLLASLVILAEALTPRLPLLIGGISALILSLTAFYCFSQAFRVMISI